MIRVAIAEEHAIMRWALREALAQIPDLQIVGDAGNVEDALAMIRRVKPEVLLLDLTLPDHSGYDVLAEIRELEASPLVVVLASRIEPTYAARAITAGAHGYVGKSSPPEQLLEAIRAVSRGERVVPPGVEALLAAGDGHPASALTKRELQVMELIARGMTNREIAEYLAVSVRTIDTHRGHVLKKLGLRNNSELTRFAVKHGYVAL
jgi:DNA-binding NarL/FixJ family response regulator